MEPSTRRPFRWSPAKERVAERVNSTRLRRMAATAEHGDRLHGLALDLLAAASAAPGDERLRRAALEWVAAWRALRDEERLDLALVDALGVARTITMGCHNGAAVRFVTAHPRRR